MLPVSALSRQALGARLRKQGLYLQTGAFITCLKSPIPHLADRIELLYADYPMAEPGYADFHITMRQAGGLRRWFKPQVQFDFDGQSPFTPLPLNQAFPMFEWVLNWCISSRAHRYLIIHAAVVERHGRALILPAPPGSGKSTLCAALVGAGWRLLSDELAMLRLDDGMLLPVPRPISLKNGSIDVIRQFAPAAVLSPAVSDTVKGTIAHVKPPADSIARAAECARPAWIVFPKYEEGAATSLAPLAKAPTFMRVAENCFNYSVLGAAGFAALAGLIEQTASYAFTYSKLDEAIAWFAALAPSDP
jgi:HprK-related kinase A